MFVQNHYPPTSLFLCHKIGPGVPGWEESAEVLDGRGISLKEDTMTLATWKGTLGRGFCPHCLRSQSSIGHRTRLGILWLADGSISGSWSKTQVQTRANLFCSFSLMGHLAACLSYGLQHSPRRASHSISHSGWCHGEWRSDLGDHPSVYCKFHTNRESKVEVKTQSRCYEQMAHPGLEGDNKTLQTDINSDLENKIKQTIKLQK